MTRRTPVLPVALVALTVLASACGSDAPAESPASVTEESMAPHDSMVTEESMAPHDSMVDEAMAMPAWQTASMTDVNGAVFTVADFVGRPVLVETFATWCKNCRAQLGDTQAAAAELGDAAVVLALSVETDLSSADVADYATDNGFADVRFAVMTPEALAAFVDAFGNTVVNPPSTPKIVVDAMGHAGELSTGAESADAIVSQLRGLAG